MCFSFSKGLILNFLLRWDVGKSLFGTVTGGNRAGTEPAPAVNEPAPAGPGGDRAGTGQAPSGTEPAPAGTEPAPSRHSDRHLR